MHSLTALITTLLLVSTSTLALRLPEGFKIIEAVPFDRAYMYEEAKGNPNVPLILAKMTCERKYNVVFDDYTIVGHHWHGVTQEQLKETAKEGGLMTEWKFESWGEGEGNVECDKKTKLRFAAANQTCTNKSAGWRAKVSSKACLVDTQPKSAKATVASD